MRVEFHTNVCNTDVNGYALALEGCIFVWIGQNNITSMGLAHFPTSTLLLETPGTHSICIKGFSSMVSKLFKDKQVFVSSDIEEDEPRFWQLLFAEVKPYLETLTLPVKVEKISL